MLEQLALCREIAWALWGVSWVAFSALVSTWRLWLTSRYLREALGREMRSNSSGQRKLIGLLYSRSNQMQRQLLESFLRAPTPTLADLVESTERELRVTASEKRSTPARTSVPPPPPMIVDEPTVELTTRDFTQHSWASTAPPNKPR
jgi:hypothetical protein